MTATTLSSTVLSQKVCQAVGCLYEHLKGPRCLTVMCHFFKQFFIFKLFPSGALFFSSSPTPVWYFNDSLAHIVRRGVADKAIQLRSSIRASVFTVFFTVCPLPAWKQQRQRATHSAHTVLCFLGEFIKRHCSNTAAC